MAIRLRLRELRHALGLTQAELATRAGVRRATLSRLETSRVTAIDLAVLERLADAIGVEPGFLLSRTVPHAGAESTASLNGHQRQGLRRPSSRRREREAL